MYTIMVHKGITVEKDHFYAQMLMVNSKVKAQKSLGRDLLKKKRMGIMTFNELLEKVRNLMNTGRVRENE